MTFGFEYGDIEDPEKYYPKMAVHNKEVDVEWIESGHILHHPSSWDKDEEMDVNLYRTSRWIDEWNENVELM